MSDSLLFTRREAIDAANRLARRALEAEKVVKAARLIPVDAIEEMAAGKYPALWIAARALGAALVAYDKATDARPEA